MGEHRCEAVQPQCLRNEVHAVPHRSPDQSELRYVGSFLTIRLLTLDRTDIERYSDRYKLARSSADGTPTPHLTSLHGLKRFDRSLLPNGIFEAVCENKDSKKRGRAGEGAFGVELVVREADGSPCREGSLESTGGRSAACGRRGACCRASVRVAC